MQETSRLQRATDRSFIPLSAEQYRIWFLHQLDANLTHFNITKAFCISGPLDTAKFRASIGALMQRHEILRTTFEFDGNVPTQVVHGTLQSDVTEVIAESTPDWEQELQSVMESRAKKLFSLRDGPLFRATLYRTPDAETILLFTIHHIVADYESLGLVLRDIFSLYDLEVAGLKDDKSRLADALQYSDYAVWQADRLKSGDLLKHLDYWKERLGRSSSLLPMPTDRPRSAEMTNNGAVLKKYLSQELSDAVLGFAKQQAVTPFVLLYSVYQVLLQKYTGQDAINIGTPVSARTRTELGNVVGLLINTVVLTSEISDDPTFSELLTRNRKIAFGAFSRSEVPFERLVSELRPERDLSHNRFFQTMVMFLEAGDWMQEASRHLKVEAYPFKKSITTFELTLTFSRDAAGRLAFLVDYNTDLYDAATVQQLMDRYEVLLVEACSTPSKTLSELRCTTESEERLMLEGVCRGRVDVAEVAETVQTTFSRQAMLTPARCAVRSGVSEVSYEELETRSNRIAHWLVRKGIARGDIIALSGSRTIATVAAMLGIMKAGAAYLPLEQRLPEERAAFMLKDAGVAALVLTEDAPAWTANSGARTYRLTDHAEDIGQQPGGAEGLPSVSPDDKAYVIYTSGSTGTPKGVVVSHGNVLNQVHNVRRVFALRPEDRVLQLASMGFDVSVQEIFPTLLSGAALVLWGEQRPAATSDFFKWLADEGITVLNLTTAHWHTIVADWHTDPSIYTTVLRLVIVGGEQVSLAAWTKWQALTKGAIRWVNDYGLTETTVSASMYEPAADAPIRSTMPIGTPLDNVQLYVLDKNLRPLPSGVFGELCVGGVGVAQGYINQAQLTAERFVQNPFGPGRLFRTGDRARLRADGMFEFEGRNDAQVKIRGHRVECQEVEAKIGEFSPSVRGAVSTTVGASGARTLIAHVTSAGEDFSLAELRAFLRKSMPEYMVPSEIQVVEELPLTINGKLDRQRLHTLTAVRSKAETIAPRTTTEEAVVACCDALLGHRPSVTAEFFEEGGDSLIATQLVARIRKHTGVAVSVKALFEYPILEEFANHIDELASATDDQQGRCLVKLKRAGSKLPIFYVHPVGGGVGCYLALSRGLNKDQPFYAFQSHVMANNDASVSTVEEMVESYLKELREVQPTGPYRLGGWSMGGFVAFEIARQLMAEGEEVVELSLVDSYLTLSKTATDDSILTNFLLQLGAVPGKTIPSAWLSRLTPERLSNRAEIFEDVRRLGLVPETTTNEELERLVKAYGVTVWAFKKYSPRIEKPLEIPHVHLFRANDSRGKACLWDDLVPAYALHDLDAGHFDIVYAPEVAKVLNAHSMGSPMKVQPVPATAEG